MSLDKYQDNVIAKSMRRGADRFYFPLLLALIFMIAILVYRQVIAPNFPQGNTVFEPWIRYDILGLILLGFGWYGGGRT